MQNETLETQKNELEEQRNELKMTRKEYHLNRYDNEIKSTQNILQKIYSSFEYQRNPIGKSSWDDLKENLIKFNSRLGSFEIEKYDVKGCLCDPEIINFTGLNPSMDSVYFETLKKVCNEISDIIEVYNNLSG